MGCMVSTTDMFPTHTHLQEAISLLEQEVVIDQLLLNFLGHASERIELALQLALQTGQRAGDLLLHFLVLGFSQAGIEGVALEGPSTSHPCRDDVLTLQATASSFKQQSVPDTRHSAQMQWR